MVILLCSTPRRGMIAVATHGTPGDYKNASKRALAYAPGTGKDEENLEEIWTPNTGQYHRHSRSRIRKSMTATPTYGHSCFPFAVNCRFSKTFFGVPKKCGYCQKIIVGTGFACQNCRFRCHKKCIMIGRGSQVCLRPKPCSLSRLPPGDEALISKLLKESEINSNDMDSVFVELEHEDDDTEISSTSQAMTSANSSRPSLANSSSFVGGIRSIAPSLTSDEPSTSPPASPSVSNPSSPTYPSNGSTQIRPVQRQRKIRQQQHQRSANMLLLALAAGVERRPSSTSTTSSKQQITTPGIQRQPPGFMDRFFKLFPSWTQKENPNMDASQVERSSSVISASSSISMINASERDTKRALPRAKSACSSMVNDGWNSKRPHTLSACSTTSNNNGANSNSRTPVDEFNFSILEDLFAVSQLTNQLPATLTSNGQSNTKPSQFLRRKLLWAKHMAGDRSARSQDFVNSNVVGSNATNCTDSNEHKHSPAIRARSATIRAGTRLRSIRKCSAVPFVGGRLRQAEEEEGRWVEDVSEKNECEEDRERLANTWPLSGLHMNHDESSEQRRDEEIGCPYSDAPENFDITHDGLDPDSQDCLSEESRHRQQRLSDLGEWTIPYSDLEFGECVHACRNMTTYKGRWHGDVMIHTFDMSGTESDRLMRSFLDDVRTLTKIRHENIALFMGASIEAPKVALVTSIRKGCSLYEAVHIENRRISQHAKLNVVRQVAQGMGYLHAKGIVVKTLTSKSIYLECKVKISTLDDGAPLKKNDVIGTGCVRRGHLTYISPELMQTLRVEPPALIVAGVHAKESDIYAFGTILYELYAGDFPFAQLQPECIVWTIGNGRRQDLERVNCNVNMKSLIEDCWSPDTTYRPSFTEVLKDLQKTAAFHKKHSSSVPEKLNKAGLHRLYNY